MLLGPLAVLATSATQFQSGLAMATQAVGQSGDEELGARAAEVLDRTRRELYRMLAESELDRDDATGDTVGTWDEDEDDVTDGEIIDD
ncbi:MAG: hypothetical protein DCC50_07910 [Acidobacteria bacterium]|nr:MAG: hypothetical protein DCC50_07910 [Acidobacteriota bacterium]